MIGQKLFQEFKLFISRGNVLDLAVAVIMGSAFTGIVNALVNDIVTPILGIILGGVNFGHLSIKLGEASILYGKFIQAIINFFLISVVVFFLIKALNTLQKRVLGRTEKKTLTHEIKLLTEIRDLLKEKDLKLLKKLLFSSPIKDRLYWSSKESIKI